ncbi:MAG: phage tail tube protein [Lachnoclostridium sp.]|jgi:hypothetical protein|nr:phage tail tube protein [Lachnoclostridium sp.]
MPAKRALTGAALKPEQVFNGTWGELWVDGDYVAQITSCKIEVNLKYTAISQVQKLQEGQKLTGIEMKGEMKMHKINSYMMNKISASVKEGKTPVATIISKISDPDGVGTEQITCSGCKFDKLILADWEAGKNMEESYSFTFEDYEINESATAEAAK